MSIIRIYQLFLGCITHIYLTTICFPVIISFYLLFPPKTEESTFKVLSNLARLAVLYPEV